MVLERGHTDTREWWLYALACNSTKEPHMTTGWKWSLAHLAHEPIRNWPATVNRPLVWASTTSSSALSRPSIN